MERATYGREGTLPSASWVERAADRLARWAWQTLLVIVAVAVIGGVVVAVWDAPSGDPPAASLDECENPPCFSIGSPSAIDLFVIVPTIGYVVVILLGIPSLLVGARDLIRRRHSVGGKRLLIFFGPLAVFIGMELLPHVLTPCLFASANSDALSAICEPMSHDPAEVDIAGRWHALHHAVVGGLLMTALYWRALLRWRPAVARFPRQEHDR